MQQRLVGFGKLCYYVKHHCCNWHQIVPAFIYLSSCQFCAPLCHIDRHTGGFLLLGRGQPAPCVDVLHLQGPHPWAAEVCFLSSWIASSHHAVVAHPSFYRNNFQGTQPSHVVHMGPKGICEVIQDRKGFDLFWEIRSIDKGGAQISCLMWVSEDFRGRVLHNALARPHQHFITTNNLFHLSSSSKANYHCCHYHGRHLQTRLLKIPLVILQRRFIRKQCLQPLYDLY